MAASEWVGYPQKKHIPFQNIHNLCPANQRPLTHKSHCEGEGGRGRKGGRGRPGEKKEMGVHEEKSEERRVTGQGQENGK